MMTPAQILAWTCPPLAALAVVAEVSGAVTAGSTLEHVERLGGWAVVCWIVWWLTRRWESVMRDQIAAQARTTDVVADLARAMQEHERSEGQSLTRLIEAVERQSEQFAAVLGRLERRD